MRSRSVFFEASVREFQREGDSAIDPLETLADKMTEAAFKMLKYHSG